MSKHTTDLEDLLTPLIAGSRSDNERYDSVQQTIMSEPKNQISLENDHDPMDTDFNPYFRVNKEYQKSMNRIDQPDKIVDTLTKLSDEQIIGLRGIINFILQKEPSDENDFKQVLKEASKKFHQIFSKTDMWHMYLTICKENKITPSDHYRKFFQYKPYRSQSGVMVYAIFTHPFWREENNGTGEMKSFSCEYDCSYCPEQPGRPRSYVDGEPGLDRAHSVNYDTVEQFHTRANTYRATGHVNDKAECIVLGGTWHSYPLEYRRNFIRDLYYAANTVHENRGRKKGTMEEEIELNQTSKCRVIGLTIETRPDRITPIEIIELRRMGCTRVQLGLQHTNDRLLRRIKRRCTAQNGMDAIKLLKDSGFKVDGHLMPDLPKPFTHLFEQINANELDSRELNYTEDDIDYTFKSVEADREMFRLMLEHPAWQIDQWKIYPCDVVPWSAIERDFKKGIHIPYGTDDPNSSTNPLIELLIWVKSRMNPTVRLNRVIRDIPEQYIMGGIKDLNGRQKIHKIMESRGLKCICIRCREIKKDVPSAGVRLIAYESEGSGGIDICLQYLTDSDQLLGFLRMRLSPDAGMSLKRLSDGSVRKKVVFEELVGCCLIRELHVYGETTPVRQNSDAEKFSRTQQHVGYGTKLINCCFQIAQERGYKKISVIAGEGVRPYYRKFGFVDTNGLSRQMIKVFDTNDTHKDQKIQYQTIYLGEKYSENHQNVESKDLIPIHQIVESKDLMPIHQIVESKDLVSIHLLNKLGQNRLVWGAGILFIVMMITLIKKS